MKCRECGTELPDDAAFCYRCGLPVQENDETKEDSLEDLEKEAPSQSSQESSEEDTDALDEEEDVVVPLEALAEDSGKSAVFTEGVEDHSADATAEVASPDPTLQSDRRRAQRTQVARRREKTVLSGETTPLEGGIAGAYGHPDDLGATLGGLDDLSGLMSDATPVPPPQETPPEPVEEKPRPIMAYVFLGIAAVVVAGVLTAFVTWRMELWGGATVPDVMGLSEQEATQQLEDSGFEVEVEPLVVDEGVGTVVSMQPQAGRRVATGRVVELGIGVDRTVPAIEGLELNEAREALAHNGIDHLRLEYQNSSEPKGTVISASPVAGSRVTADDVVTIVVAQPFTVPDVIGLTADAAKAALERAGLRMDMKYVTSEDVAAGRVVGTDPAAGTEMAEDALVLVTVSSPFPQTTFDLEGYLASSPGDISAFLNEQGYSVIYAQNDDGIARMTWELESQPSAASPNGSATSESSGGASDSSTRETAQEGSGSELLELLDALSSPSNGGGAVDTDTAQPEEPQGQSPSTQAQTQGDGDTSAQRGAEDKPPLLGFTALPFSLPSGFQFWPADVLLQGAKIEGVYLPLSSEDLSDSSVTLEVSQDCITQLMNLCGLRSTTDTTTTATHETVTPELDSNAEFVAKAGSMDGYTWYVVVWDAQSSRGMVNAALGLAPSDSLLARLQAQGYDLGNYDNSMANLAAHLVLNQSGTSGLL